MRNIVRVMENSIRVATIGTQGPAGVGAGTDGRDGVDGRDGIDGVDGAPGADGRDGTNGTNGTNGADGAPGPQGVQGIQGATGAAGAAGRDGTNGRDGFTPQVLRYQFNATTTATTDGFSQLGYWALNHVNPAMATLFQISNHDLLIHDDAAIINSWGNGTSTIKGTLYIGRLSDNDVVVYQITGRTTTTGMAEFNVSYVGGSFSPALVGDQQVHIGFIPTGDKGEQGPAGRDGVGGGGSDDVRGYATIAARNADTTVTDFTIAIVADTGSGAPGHFYRSGGTWHTGAGGATGARGASVSVPYILDGNHSVPATGNIDGRLFVNSGDADSIDTITLAIRDTDGVDRRPYFLQKFGGTSDVKGFIEIENTNPNTGANLGILSVAVSSIATSSRIITLTKSSGTANAVVGTGLSSSGSTLAVFTVPNGDKGTTGAVGAAGRDGADGDVGPRGLQGEPGIQGEQGATGARGTDGTNGTDGADGADAVVDATTLASVPGPINTTATGNDGRIRTTGANADVVAEQGNLGAGRADGTEPNNRQGNCHLDGYMKLGTLTTTQRASQTAGTLINGTLWHNGTTGHVEARVNGAFSQVSGCIPFPSGSVQNGTLISINADGDVVYLDPSALPGTSVSLTAANEETDANHPNGRIAVSGTSNSFTISMTPPIIPSVAGFKQINTSTATSGQLNVVAQIGSNLQLVGLLERFVGDAATSPTGSLLSIVNRGTNAQDRQFGFRPAPSGGSSGSNVVIRPYSSSDLTPVAGRQEITLPSGDRMDMYQTITIEMYLSLAIGTANDRNFVEDKIDVFHAITSGVPDLALPIAKSSGRGGLAIIIHPFSILETSTSFMVNVVQTDTDNRTTPGGNLPFALNTIVGRKY